MQFECEKPKDETELIEKSICGMWRELLKCDDDDDEDDSAGAGAAR